MIPVGSINLLVQFTELKETYKKTNLSLPVMKDFTKNADEELDRKDMWEAGGAALSGLSTPPAGP